MLALDRDALVCDMAETYQIFDIDSVPLKLLATLASGLGMDSRIRLKRYGLKASWQTVILAKLMDVWTDPGNSVSQIFIEKVETGIKSNSMVFDSPEEFEAARAAIIGGNNG